MNTSRLTRFRPGRRRPDSFTLIEIVFAISISAFVLISLMGLMAYTSQLVQQSNKYARLSSVSSQVIASMESKSFALTSIAASNNSAFYYTYDGLPTNVAGAYYQCNVTNATPAGWTLPTVIPVKVTICWPYITNNPFANTNVIVTSVVKYD